MGLKFKVDLDYIKKNPKPSPEHLKENIITEAIVSSLTSLDNFCSLPIAVDYATQSGKTGQTMTILRSTLRHYKLVRGAKRNHPIDVKLFHAIRWIAQAFATYAMS